MCNPAQDESYFMIHKLMYKIFAGLIVACFVFGLLQNYYSPASILSGDQNFTQLYENEYVLNTLSDTGTFFSIPPILSRKTAISITTSRHSIPIKSYLYTHPTVHFFSPDLNGEFPLSVHSKAG